MWATGNKQSARRTAAGFTLIELMVTITVIGLAMGASVAAWPKLSQAMDYRATVRGVLAGMKTARSEAMRSGRPALFFVDLSSRSYGVAVMGDDDKVLGRFPDSVSVRYVLAEQEIDQRGRGRIRFAPGGGATGGSVDLLRANSGGVRLRVDWLFGTVSQETIAG
ncbi:MAG: GspH/FimT family pseudopilin [Azoarcus sp.]|jgi:general secretion pathway protein H|nr:GspH/FimT family pseudopilin [Azoarcus sp.]